MIELIEAGWDVSIYRQKKRVDGEFKTLFQWRAKRFDRLREFTNDNKGYATAQEAVEEMKSILITIP